MLMDIVFQIKNVIRAAHALAVQERAPVSYSHLEIVIESGKEFEADSTGGRATNDQSYF